MRKKMLAILLSAVMVFSFIIPAFAETPYSDVPDYHWVIQTELTRDRTVLPDMSWH